MNRFFGAFTWLLSANSLLITACSAQGQSEQLSTRESTAVALAIGQIVRDCADCPELVAVPQVGHTVDKPGKIFYAGRFEITWREYLVAVREGACPVPMEDRNKPYNVNDTKINDDYPLTTIGPDEFPCYLKWLRKKSGKIYRIPSAAEWEHIARAGTATEYYWGDGLGYNNAIVFGYFDLQSLRKNLGYPQTFFREDPRSDVKWGRVYPVGQFKPNPWGLYDVIGNVAEVTTEPFPALNACLKNQPVKVCEAVSVRGNVRGRSPNPGRPNPPITKSLLASRDRAPAHGGTYLTGFRVVRD